MLRLTFLLALATPAHALAPSNVLLAEPMPAYLPDGSRVLLPAGTEFDVCNPAYEFHQPTKTMVLLRTCAERSLFTDGFEDVP